MSAIETVNKWTRKIKEFAKSTNTNISEATLERKFFILAPKQNFMEDKKVEIVVVDRDPIMFYKIDDNHWRFIHKWGNDFSILRLISGYKFKNFETYFLVTCFERMPLWFAAMALIFPTFFATNTIWFVVIHLFVGFAGNFLLCGLIADNAKENKAHMFSEDGWNNFESTTTIRR